MTDYNTYLLYNMSPSIPGDIPDHKFQKICYSCGTE